MAEYPPTPAFGMASTGGVPPQPPKTSHDQPYEYRDLEKISGLGSHRAHTEDAFQYNARIPTFSTAAVASGIPPLPIHETRDTHMYSYPPDPYGRDARFGSPARRNLYTNPSYSSPARKIPDIPPQGDRATSSHISKYQVEEEGELSEGEFEEAPQQILPSNVAVFRRREQYEQATEDRHDHAYRNNYDSSGELESTSHVPLTDIYGRSLDLHRPRSESYSPYELPNEMEYEPPSGPALFLDENDSPYQGPYEPADDFQHVQSRSQKGNYENDLSRISSLQPPRAEYSPQPLHTTSELSFGVIAASVDRAPVKSLRDARKEAQSAILNLLPLKVRYRDYIDEGIDEVVVRRQFESLGMPQANAELPSSKPDDFSRSLNSPYMSTRAVTNKSPVAELTNAPRSRIVREAAARNTLNEFQPVSSTASNPTGRLTKINSNVAEERKDRIARLLAENKQKHSSSAMRPNSPTTSASPDASAAVKMASASQLAAKADKERLLRQKMEALQKSREQRAQKAASKSAVTVPTISNADTVNTSQSSTDASSHRQSTTDQQSPKPESQKSTSPVTTTLNKPTMPSIPGLFLAAGSSAPGTPTASGLTSSTTQNGLQRKRPVASDFDRPPSAGTSYKRPFGQNRNDQPLVIDVSDEESDDGDINEIDMDHSHPEPSGVPQNGISAAKPKAARELPPLSDFPPQKVLPISVSAASTPHAPQSSLKPSVSKPEDLQKKEMEIQAMRKRIAEAERRKRAKQNMSGSQTPRSNDSTSSPAKSGNAASIADKIEASVQIEQLIDSASRQVNQNQAKLAAAHAAEEVKVGELKQSEAERRRLRRAEIASGLPVVDAEVEKGQKRLADLRAEVAEIEAAVKKGLEEKERLAEEMEKLSQEADEQLHLQKARLDELTLEDNDRTDESRLVGDLKSVNKISTSPAVIDTSGSRRADSELNANATAPKDQASGNMNGISAVEPAVTPQIQTDEPDQTGEILRQSAGEASPMAGVDRESDSYPTHLTPDQTLEAALQEASADGAIDSERASESEVDMADSYAPDPEILAPASTKDSPGNNQQESSHVGSGDEVSEDGDYEPPEATPPATDGGVSLGSPSFSPAPPEADPTFSRMETQQEAARKPEDLILSGSALHIGDDTVPSARSNESHSGAEARKSFFTPYESPLKSFRAYRFHPSFKQDVEGGFKSLTYSNNIKDDQELCRYELAGGVCNDATCEYQHFRDMGLADDAILVELGNSAGYSEEDKPRFVTGLRSVLQGLRTKKTKDFQIIASEIAAYRARFLGDKSKVLLLDGTTI